MKEATWAVFTMRLKPIGVRQKYAGKYHEGRRQPEE
jgi:hypothetical protein